tara:strand:+ start:1308 stop:1820 length:513 start_codon:yes stop_codon:yes gene_type:complete
VYQNRSYIVLGTNKGNWKNNFNQALSQIKHIGLISNFSGVYLSKPYGYNKQNDFYNMAIELRTDLNAIKLLLATQLIEKRMKKNKLFKNGPRIIDLDIIFFNKIILRKNFLILPHPRAHLRDFVLQPICEINPFYVHPILKKTMKEIYLNLNKKFVIKIIRKQRENLLIF